GDEPFVDQALQRLAHRDAGHAELLHQHQLAGQALLETTLVQLLAQHEVDLVVLGQRQGVGHALEFSTSYCSVNRTYDLGLSSICPYGEQVLARSCGCGLQSSDE